MKQMLALGRQRSPKQLSRNRVVNVKLDFGGPIATFVIGLPNLPSKDWISPRLVEWIDTRYSLGRKLLAHGL
jgi:hypothetical protein